jgi:hypothetical protein
VSVSPAASGALCRVIVKLAAFVVREEPLRRIL